MQRQALRVLIALAVFLAATLPVGARAMLMPAGMSGAAVQQHCQSCPQPPMTRAHSGKMPACQVLACADAVATLPAPTLLPGRILLRAAYMMVPLSRWTDTRPAPDPFPPRPIALV